MPDAPRRAPRSTRPRTVAIVATIVVVVIAVTVVVIWQWRSASGERGDSSPDTAGSSDSDVRNRKIVVVTAIDLNGNEVESPDPDLAADPAGDGKAQCPPVSIAMAGALTGPDAKYAFNVKNGAQLAVDRHNQANPGCQVELKSFDTMGDPPKASQIAPQIVDDASIIGLVGPAFSGETLATGAVFNQAGLVAATASATNAKLSQNGWRTFFRGVAGDGVQAPSVANYLKNNLRYDKVCVAGDSTPYGSELAQAVKQSLGDVADSACDIAVEKGDQDFSAAVVRVREASPDAVFYAGYYAEAAPFLRQLRVGGVTATFVASDGSQDPEFISQAGGSSKDALLSCPCSPAPQGFADYYSRKFAMSPGNYSTEAFDLATIMLKGIDSGAHTRPALLEFVRNYSGQGLAGHYQWAGDGELVVPMIWISRVQ